MVGVCAPHSQQLGALHEFCCGSRMLSPLDALRHVQHFPAQRHSLRPVMLPSEKPLSGCIVCCLAKYQCKVVTGYSM